MKYIAEVIIRTNQFEADTEEDARDSAWGAFTDIVTTPGYGQIIEVGIYEVEDID